MLIGETETTQEVVLKPLPAAGSLRMGGRLVSRTGEWLGHASVGLLPGQPGLEGLQWTMPVPEDGRWEWRTAPDHPVKLRFSAWRHEDRVLELAPGEAETEVVLDFVPDVLVRGTVRSEETGEPVPRFRVIRANAPRGNEYVSDPELLGEGFDGRFAFRVSPQDLAPTAQWYRPNHPQHRAGAQIMIQAEGLLQQIFPLPPATHGEVVVDLRVSSDTPTEGTVVLPDHRPAEGAQVSYRGPQLGMFLGQPTIFGTDYTDERQPGQAKAVTGTDGTFRLRRVDGATRLAVVHPDGWANVPLTGLPREPVWLQPWGRIEGVVAIGGQLWPGIKVRLAPATADPEQFLLGFETVADAEGRFVFPQVPAGRFRTFVERLGDRIGVFSNPAEVTVRAGQTSPVTIGGSGIRVQGRIVPEPGDLPVGWNRSPLQLVPRVPVRPGARPTMMVGYAVFCAEDGSFAFEDVAPGEYRLVAELRSPARDNGSGPTDAERTERMIGQMNRDLSVGPASNGALDLGGVEIRVSPPR